jgi:hypothetical protein
MIDNGRLHNPSVCVCVFVFGKLRSDARLCVERCGDETFAIAIIIIIMNHQLAQFSPSRSLSRFPG